MTMISPCLSVKSLRTRSDACRFSSDKVAAGSRGPWRRLCAAESRIQLFSAFTCSRNDCIAYHRTFGKIFFVLQIFRQSIEIRHGATKQCDRR